MNNMVEYLANHFFYGSLKKDPDLIQELAESISKKKQNEIREFLYMLGGIISGHTESSEKLSPSLKVLNMQWTENMNKINNSEMEGLK